MSSGSTCIFTMILIEHFHEPFFFQITIVSMSIKPYVKGNEIWQTAVSTSNLLIHVKNVIALKACGLET